MSRGRPAGQRALPAAALASRRGETPRVEVGRRSAWLRGVPRNLINRLNIPVMYCPVQKCWTVPRARADEVIAHYEGRGIRVSVREVDR